MVALFGLFGVVTMVSRGNFRPGLPPVSLFPLWALLVWAAVSSFWSMDGDAAQGLTFRLVLLCLAGWLSLAQCLLPWSPPSRRVFENALLFGYGLGLLALLTGYIHAEVAGDSLWGSYYFDPLTTMNNGAVVMALLMWPAALIVWRRFHPLATVGLGFIVTGGLSFLSSGASLLSVVTGMIVFCVVFLFKRRGGFAVAVITAILILAAPQVVTVGFSSDAVQSLIAKAPPSVGHRQKMWDFAVSKIGEKPALGWGMDASRNIPQEEFRLLPNMEIMPLHPHNAALQIHLELGLPGALLAAVLVIAVFAQILKPGTSRQSMSINAAGASAYLSVASVSYGVWQNWWVGTAWALAAILALMSHDQYFRIPERKAGPEPNGDEERRRP